jgi:hypothetical protein
MQKETCFLADEILASFIQSDSIFEINIEKKQKQLILDSIPPFKAAVMKDFLKETQDHIFFSM